jgi:multidrug efflux pump subunit AcrA (membrane-fusion protein)
LDAQKQEIKIDQEKIVAPFDGIVQKLNVEKGEMADPQNRDGALTVVKNDPLWVEMHLPTAAALRLQPNEILQVRYADHGEWKPAKVILLDPQADAASDTERVRLELPNPTQQVSGLQVQVKLPDAGVASRE